MEPDVIDLASAVTSAVPFVAHLGLRLDATASPPRVDLPDDPRLGNHLGTRHAGALFTAAETASGLAVLDLITRRRLEAAPVVVGASIRYHHAARGPIRAAAEIGATDDQIVTPFRERGRAEVATAVTLTDELGTVVASADVAWLLRQRRSS